MKKDNLTKADRERLKLESKALLEGLRRLIEPLEQWTQKEARSLRQTRSVRFGRDPLLVGLRGADTDERCADTSAAAEKNNVRQLILVRHAQPEIVQGVPAREWRLSAEGRAASVVLADQLTQYKPSVLASSTEQKALQTAEIVGSRLGLRVTPIAGLHEHERDAVSDLDQRAFEARVAAFFAHPQELVWGAETAAQARDRFTRTVDSVVHAHPAGDVIVVAHGTVITLYVAARTGVETFAFWQRLRLPDVVALTNA